MKLLDFPPIAPNTPESIADRAVNRLFNGHPGESKRFTRAELRELLTQIQIVALENCRPGLMICTDENDKITIHGDHEKCEVCR